MEVQEDLEKLAKLPVDGQAEYLKTWFFQNYADPVESCPYISREGGYLYIYGGPYDARDELSVFSDAVSEEVIEAVAQDLETQCFEWSGIPEPEAYEHRFLDLILSDKDHYSSVESSIESVQQLIQAPVEGEASQHLRQLLFVSCITAMESYLFDVFVHAVMTDEKFLKRYVKTNKDFKKEKLPLSEIFDAHAEIKNKAKLHLLGKVWHNLAWVKEMYKQTLGIEFPNDDDLEYLFKAVQTRHHIVHRNGKDADGLKVEVSESDLRVLIHAVQSLITDINERFLEVWFENPSKISVNEIEDLGGF